MDLSLCMDVDIDCGDNFNGEDGPLGEFLAHKLKSIQDANQQLRTTIEEVKCSIVNAEAVKGGAHSLIAGSIRKRYHNGKWCFIVDVSSSDSNITYKDFDVSLKWSPIIAPQYTLTIYSNDVKKFVTRAKIATEIRVIVAFESIAFVRHKNCEAEAVLFYGTPNISNAGEDDSTTTCRYGLKLGVFQLAVEEMNTGALEIKNIHLINNQRDDVLAALACSAQIKLAMTLQMGVLRDYLVIDCMFRELMLDGSKLFLLNTNVNHLDGCILTEVEEDGVNLVTLYVRDQTHFHNVLHHLHATIKGVTIMPLKCIWQLQKQKRLQPNADDDNQDEDAIFSSQACLQSQRPRRFDANVKQFGECLLRQIDSVIDFHRNVVGNKENSPECDVTQEYHAMRNSLTQHESTTDLLYQHLNI